MKGQGPDSGARRWGALLICCGILAATACGRRDSNRGSLGVFPMGERVRVGPLIYTVQDAEWRDQLGEGVNLRMPRHRFLLVRLSITNSGIREIGVPPLSLIAGNGDTYEELTDGKEVPEWLGLLRAIQPSATEHGRVLFDAPGGSYRLRVAAEAESDEQPFALIEIPFQLPPATPLATPPGAPMR